MTPAFHTNAGSLFWLLHFQLKSLLMAWGRWQKAEVPATHVRKQEEAPGFGLAWHWPWQPSWGQTSRRRITFSHPSITTLCNFQKKDIFRNNKWVFKIQCYILQDNTCLELIEKIFFLVHHNYKLSP